MKENLSKCCGVTESNFGTCRNCGLPFEKCTHKDFIEENNYIMCKTCKMAFSPTEWAKYPDNVCKHEDTKLLGAIANTHLCFKCSGQLVCNEIEIFNSFHEVGGFCNNEKCERFLLLVV